MKRISIICLLSMVVCVNLFAQTPISPAYYGPNAFEVPRTGFGKITPGWLINVGASKYILNQKEWDNEVTISLDYHIGIPLFSDRVTLSVWGQFANGYIISEEGCAQKGFEGPVFNWRNGGELYFATEVQILRQQRCGVNLCLRAACKTAAGGNEEHKRYYDSPGYFFDLTVGRKCRLAPRVYIEPSLAAGFLCWQTGKAQQNDAYMYSAAFRMEVPVVTISAQWAGYNGWQRNGDRPMVFRTDIDFRIEHVDVGIGCTYGIRDWNYVQMSMSAKFNFGKHSPRKGKTSI